ncbi:biotin--acetyl-CoA-carboxylase ligase [Roseivivax halodurans JCM 10272]|uniref:biotin--[biotin carboxyl-carrier protein] ligase n=1 Tax=Roseivivax halodurans JCM 10272 TaxID=1449350 RepID=X7EEM8_9RHOB|nr:biotin--[acetyl-CoA-carboxylase] ligase [Roseivivax halodurans]ETX14539.1 biotin--acetyl-CoA-carboxylase ligase [Roseivivax halodurans JCM 10272]
MSWPAGYARVELDEVDSTMAEAARRAPEAAGPVWIFAHRQTAARGRRGRAWVEEDGNFAATLLLPVAGPAQHLALRSFVASLALVDALVAVTGRAEPFSLKWPNDVLLNGGKVAGILLESHGGRGAGGAAHLAVGIGVNLRAAPGAEAVEPGAMRPVALLPETGADVAPEDFLEHLAEAYARREAAFRTFGFDPIRQAWLAGAARVGETVTARTGTSATTGTFETVDPSGHLVLSTPSGRIAVAAADVFF